MNQFVPVNHEHFYPNMLVVREYVENLVKFCDRSYRVLEKKFTEDEERNQPLKYEHREYEYKKSYGSGIKIYMWTNSNVSLDYDNADAFCSASGSGRLNDISSLTIDLGLNFGRGKEGEIEDHKNEFKMTFRPYDIKFTRNSNYSDPEMDELEEQIVKLMEDFPATKTIFTPEQ